MFAACTLLGVTCDSCPLSTGEEAAAVREDAGSHGAVRLAQ